MSYSGDLFRCWKIVGPLWKIISTFIEQKMTLQNKLQNDRVKSYSKSNVDS